jgi:hypothetical protein
MHNVDNPCSTCGREIGAGEVAVYFLACPEGRTREDIPDDAIEALQAGYTFEAVCSDCRCDGANA